MTNTKTKSKNKKTRKKLSKIRITTIIFSIIAFLGLVGLLAGVGLIISMLKDKPELDLSKLDNHESSIIYDVKGNVIAELGMTIRENVSYDELPASLIDAFVAVEDSRFYAHNGFDLPRFTRAIFANLKSLSFSQGGSTFTMQLVKNAFFVDDEAGIGAARRGLDGVRRKVQEIALAIELENSISKDSIFELYINKINFGGNRNIRGIQKASEYFFNKNVSELSLPESAMLAGVINAPSAYNPFKHIEAATRRRNTVLDLMELHGYITKEECALAKSVKVEDLLVDPYKRANTGTSSKYQAYIDEVISETYRITGLDPYTTTMNIYTYMEPEVQELMDNIQKGEVDGYFEYPDEYFELASISVNNKTGAINAILGGRNYASGGALLLNHATDQYKQPGSAIKPIIDYVLAFENLGWSTSHVLVDKPITYAGTSVIIANANGKYQGEVTLKDALGNSLNTTAIQTLQEVLNKTSNAYVVDYLQSLGFDINLEEFNIQYAIGGSTIETSCKQMAGAYAAIMNYGNYIEPHTIKKIEFANEKAPITPVHNPVQVVSPQSAYLMTDLLYSNVYGGYANLMQILKDDYAIYAKTGTTDWGTSGRQYGIPDGSAKDGWVCAGTSEFSVATWIGYEKASSDRQSYITMKTYLSNIQGKVTNLIHDKNAEVYGKPNKISRPDGITTISHIIGVFPYTFPIEGMDEQYITSGYINSKDAKLTSPETITVAELSGANIGINTDDNGIISIEWSPYPEKEKLVAAGEEMDISLYGSSGNVIYNAVGTRLFDYSWVYGPVRYKAEIYINGEKVEEIAQIEEKYAKKFDLLPNDKVIVKAYYGFEKSDKHSNIITKEMEIEDRDIVITFPDASIDTKNKLKKWAEENNVKIKIVETPYNSQNPVGTYRIQKLGKKNEYYHVAETVSFKESKLLKATFTIEFFIDTSFVITTDKTEFKAGDIVTLSVSPKQDVIFEIVNSEGKAIATIEDNILTIHDNAKANDIIEIKATSKNDSTNSQLISIIISE